MASNNNPINSENLMEQLKIQRHTQYTLSNFINAVNQHNTAELESFIKSPERLYYILLSLGIPEDFLHTPAHRYIFENMLCKAIKTIIDSRFSIIDTHNYLPKFYKVEIGSSVFVTDSFSVELDGSLYKIVEFHASYGKYQDKSKEITFDINDKSVLEIQEDLSESEHIDLFHNKITHYSSKTKAQLDSNGFVISNHIINSINFTPVEEQTLNRNGLTVCIHPQVNWNGNPLYLNSRKSDNKTVINNISKTIRRCPNSKNYYISVFGKDLIDAITKLQEHG